MKIYADRLQHDVFKKKYRGFIRSFGAAREFYRYRLFRNELLESKITTIDVKFIIPLLDLEHRTLGSYVAQRPLPVWIASTMTAVLTASATNWPFEYAIGVAVIGGVMLFMLHIIPMFISEQRMLYELRRWLAWYEADSAETDGIAS